MNRTQPKMQPKTIDDLPELPFKRILSYLSLSDLLKARAVSRGWYQRINCRKVKSLCCSERPILANGQMVSGAYAQNFISTPQADRLFAVFASTILSDLKHLRLCNLGLNAEYIPTFERTLNSFRQLQELDVIRVTANTGPIQADFKLNLPMLHSIHLKHFSAVNKLTLDSPRLKQITLWGRQSLALVHGESVERLLIQQLKYLPVKNLKNLKQLHVEFFCEFDSALLSSLTQLKELHLVEGKVLSHVLKQKQRCGNTDLKIYCFGCLLNDPEDPLVTPFEDFDEAILVHLAEHPTRLADEIPLCWSLPYSIIERVAPDSTVSLLGLLKRFTDLNWITVSSPIQDTERFLDLLKDLLKDLDNIVKLQFECGQPQELFDRLSEHYAVQELAIYCEPSDLRFLFGLKNLVNLHLMFSIGLELIQGLLEALPHLFLFVFSYLNKWVQITIYHRKRLEVFVDGEAKKFANLSSAMQFIVERAGEEEGEEVIE